MRARVLFPVLSLTVLFFAACSSTRPAAHLIINNESDKDIALNVSITSMDKGGSQRTINQNIKPGLQQLAPEKLPKGMYAFLAETNSGSVSVRKNLSFDSDRWVIISFTHADSLNIHHRYGYVDTTILKKVDGKYMGIDMFADSRKPASL